MSTNQITKASAAGARRRRQLAAIHCASAKGGLDEETYRAMLKRVAGVDSAADLDESGRRKVLVELDRLAGGQRPARPSYPGRPTNMSQLPGYISKIEALLTDMRLPWSYADAICQQQTGIARVSWCSKAPQLEAVMVALITEQTKRRLAARLDELLAELGIDESDEQVQAAIPHKLRGTPRWRRNVAALQAVVDTLGRVR